MAEVCPRPRCGSEPELAGADLGGPAVTIRFRCPRCGGNMFICFAVEIRAGAGGEGA